MANLAELAIVNCPGKSSFRACVAHGSVEVQARPDAAFSKPC